jgi:hypothetical protein
MSRPRVFARAIQGAGIAVAIGAAACGPPGSPRNQAHATKGATHSAPGGIALASIEREGDPTFGVALAVATEGRTPDESARIAAALGGIVVARMKRAGAIDPSLAIGGDGYRVRARATTQDDAKAFVGAALAALAAPVGEADLAAAKDEQKRLAAKPLVTQPEAAIVRCTGEARLAANDGELTDAAVLEKARAASHVRARVAFAVTGPPAVHEAVSGALARAPALADGTPAASIPPDSTADATFLSEPATTVVQGGPSAVVTIVRPFADPAEAMEVAARLTRSPLAGRLAALDAGARVRFVDASAHPVGGCLALGVAVTDPGRDPDQTIAAAATIASEELALVLGPADVNGDTRGDAAARRMSDPRDAADAAAWLSLSRRAEGDFRTTTRIALFQGRGAKLEAADVDAALARARDLRAKPTTETRVRVERGQGDLWVMVGSPCGTLVESTTDAGIGMAAVRATASGARVDASIEEIALPDALGLAVHGPALPGESPAAHARRLVDIAARPLLGEPVTDDAARRALRIGFGTAEDDATRALAQLAALASPSHPSWLVPQGTTDALGRASERALTARVASLRAGPLRVAVLADHDADQAKAASLAVDRWLAVRSNEARTCEPLAPAEVARSGTYGVTRTTPGPSEAFIAAPIADAKSIRGAQALAALLGGRDGLLTKALAGGLAREESVRVLGTPRAAALVVRVTTADGALDAAVLQVRALYQRLAAGALSEDDAKRGIAERTRGELEDALDPKKRLVALFRDPLDATPPDTPESLRALAQSMLKDDALVIVALRPPRAATRIPQPPRGAPP